MAWRDLEEEGSSTDFGVVGREVNLKERLREDFVGRSDAEVEVDGEAECWGVDVDAEDRRVNDIPKREWKSSHDLEGGGISEGSW